MLFTSSSMTMLLNTLHWLWLLLPPKTISKLFSDSQHLNYYYFLDCKFNCHKRCMHNVPDTCPGDEDQSRREYIILDRYVDERDCFQHRIYLRLWYNRIGCRHWFWTWWNGNLWWYAKWNFEHNHGRIFANTFEFVTCSGVSNHYYRLNTE